MYPSNDEFGKLSFRSTRGCLVGYHLSTSYKYWDFDRKCFDVSHDLIEFPGTSDFDEEPISVITQGPRTRQPPATTNPASPAAPVSVQSPQTYDQIVLEPPPSVQVYSTQSEGYEASGPATFYEALRRPGADKWIEAMISEIESIIANKTWTLCDLPLGRSCIGTKWVFKLKLDGNNNVERFKCRIVAKGYSQIAGLDFDKTFAPVVRIESVRCLLALAAYHGLHMLHIDCLKPLF